MSAFAPRELHYVRIHTYTPIACALSPRERSLDARLQPITMGTYAVEGEGETHNHGHNLQGMEVDVETEDPGYVTMSMEVEGEAHNHGHGP